MSAPVIDSHRNVFFLSEGVAASEYSAGGVDVEPKTRIVGPVVAGLLIVSMVGMAPPAGADGFCEDVIVKICVDPQVTLREVFTMEEVGSPEDAIGYVGAVKICVIKVFFPPDECGNSWDSIQATILSVGQENPPCDPWTPTFNCEDSDVGGDDEQAISADIEGPTKLCLIAMEVQVDSDGDGTPEYKVPGVTAGQPPCP